jgi:hypothetical protein
MIFLCFALIREKKLMKWFFNRFHRRGWVSELLCVSSSFSTNIYVRNKHAFGYVLI